MDKFYNITIFAKVVEMGSFTSVANHLDATVGSISRAVSALEDQLNTRLIQRTTRRLSVTDAGRRFYERCTTILADLDEAESEASNALLAPRGKLRVHSSPSLGRHLITDAVVAYRNNFPQVAVDLILSQRMPNLLEEQLDISVVIARTLPDSAYVSQKIGVSHCILAASPAYLARCPAPTSPEELSDHTVVLLTTIDYGPDIWDLTSKTGNATFRPKGPCLSVNDMDSMAVALRAGAGIGLLAGLAALPELRTGALVRVLPDFHTHQRNVFAIYSSRQYVDARTRQFLETLKSTVDKRLSSAALELDIGKNR